MKRFLLFLALLVVGVLGFFVDSAIKTIWGGFLFGYGFIFFSLLITVGLWGSIITAIMALFRPGNKKRAVQRAQVEAEETRSREIEQREEAAGARLGLSNDPARARMQARPHYDVGVATGIFRKMGGDGTPDQNEVVAMDVPTACRGTIVMGPQGSGKTSAVMFPLLEQAIEQGHGALVFAIKSDVPESVLKIAMEHGREKDMIFIAPRPNASRCNPLDVLEPEAAAQGLADGLGDPKDPYWRDAPAAFAQGHLELLKGIGARTISFPARKDKDGNETAPEYNINISYSLDSLRDTIMLDGPDLRTLQKVAVEVLAEIAEEPAHAERAQILEDALRYFARDYAATFERATNGAQMLAGLRAALLAPLKALAGDRDIRRAFGSTSDVNLEEALNAGKIVVVYVDDAKYPTAFPAVMRLIFRVLEGIMQRRLQMQSPTPVLLWMDEYATFASQKHVAPLSRSRQARIIPLIGFQSMSFLTQAMGSKEAAYAIVGSCASLVICGATDDDTAKLIQSRVGEGRWIETRETSTNTGAQQHTAAGVLSGFISGGVRGGIGASIGSMMNTQNSTGVTVSREARQENLAAAQRLSMLGPTVGDRGEKMVLAIGVFATEQDGEVRDLFFMPQIPYLDPSPSKSPVRASQSPDYAR